MILSRSPSFRFGLRPTLRVLLVALASLGVAAAWTPAVVEAQESSSLAGHSSATVELRIEDASGEDRTYRIVAATDGTPRRLKLGSRVPVPVTRMAGPERDRPQTSYQYQDVGFDAEVRVRTLGESDYRLEVRLEDSHLGVARAPSVPPAVEHHTQEFVVQLTPGRSVLVTELQGSGVSPYRVRVALESPG